MAASSGAGCGAQGVSELSKYYRKTDPIQFHSHFEQVCNHMLLVFKREPAVERAIELAVRFVATNGDETLNHMVAHLLAHHDAKDKAVRYRVCQMLGKILDALPEDAELDDELFEQIESAGKMRITDKIPAVRVQACGILTRLQDPEDAEDPVVELLLRAAQTDSSPDVRKNAMAQLAVSTKTLPAVLAATRDTAAAVRKEAYRYVKTRIDIKALSVSQRLKLLGEGLKDRAADVKAECVKMLCASWFDNKDKNRLRAATSLVGQLDVQTDVKTCQIALTEIIAFVRDWAVTAGDFAELDSDKALVWRVLVEHYQAANHDDAVERLLPSVPEFGAIVRKWGEYCAEATDVDSKLEAQFVTEQLLQMARLLDYADEAGRCSMALVLSEVLQLPSLPDSVIEHGMALSTTLHSEESDRVRVVAELIADIRQPIQQRQSAETKAQEKARVVELSKIKVKITELKIKIEEFVKQEQFTEAGHVKAEMKEMEAKRDELSISAEDEEAPLPAPKDDLETWMTCLTLAKHLLKTTELTMRTPALAGLVSQLIIPGIKNPDPVIRNLALTTLGMACLRNKTPEMAKEHLPMFLVVLRLDQDAIKQTVVRILFDFALFFGAEPFSFGGATEPDDATSEGASANKQQSIMSLLTTYLHDEDEQLRTVAVEGLCKLFLLNHVTSASILSQLALLYFNPVTADDHRLRQCLRFFFPAYAFSSTTHALVVEDAFMPTLRRVLGASKGTPLHSVKPAMVTKFFVYHTSQSEGAGKRADEAVVHESLAIKVLNEMLSSGQGAETKVLSSVLSMFDVASFSELTIASLQVLSDSLTNTIRNKTELKRMKEFQSRLEELGDATELTAEQQQAIERETAEHTAERAAQVGAMEEEDGGAASPAPAKRTTRKRGAKKAAPKYASSEEDELDDDAELDPSDIATPPPSTMARPPRTCTKTPKVAALAPEEEEEEEEPDVEPETYEVEYIVESRKKRRAMEYLVKWKGYPESDNTWEPAKNLADDIIAAFQNEGAAAVSENTEEAKGEGAAAPTADDIDQLLDDAEVKSAKRATRRRGGRSKKSALAELNDDVDELLA